MINEKLHYYVGKELEAVNEIKHNIQLKLLETKNINETDRKTLNKIIYQILGIAHLCDFLYGRNYFLTCKLYDFVESVREIIWHHILIMIR